jgi:adenylyltransferase/sulfurtransferase
VVDASDNFATRFAINDACVKNSTPLISGAASRFNGQVCAFDLKCENSPCYRCLYDDDEMAAGSCTESGVVAPLLGVIGSIQALEAIKLLTNTGEPLRGRLLLFDALKMEWRSVRVRKDPLCSICQYHVPYRYRTA